MSNIKEQVEEFTQELLDFYNINSFYTDDTFGLQYITYLYNTEQQYTGSLFISEEDAKCLTSSEVQSLLNFGVQVGTISNLTDSNAHYKDAYIIEFSSQEDLLKELKRVKGKLNTSFLNYIVLVDTASSNMVNYDESIVNMLKQFKASMERPQNLYILEYNLLVDYTSSAHSLGILKSRYEDGSFLVENLNYYVENPLDCSKAYFFSNSKNLGDTTLFNLAYIALRDRLNLNFDDVATTSKFTLACKYLFSFEYLPISEQISLKLKTKSSRVFCATSTETIPAVFEFYNLPVVITAIPVEALMTTSDVSTILITESKNSVVIDYKKTIPTKRILNTYIPRYISIFERAGRPFDSLSTAMSHFLNTAQSILMVHTGTLVSFKELIFFVSEKTIYVGYINQHSVNKLNLVTKINDNVRFEVSLNSILPTQLYECTGTQTNYSMPILNCSMLRAVYDNYINDKTRYGYYLSLGLIDEALLSLRVVDDKEVSSYFSDLRAEDINLCKNINVQPSGAIEKIILMAP